MIADEILKPKGFALLCVFESHIFYYDVLKNLTALPKQLRILQNVFRDSQAHYTQERLTYPHI
jgi:hypothetical protein